MPVETHVLWPLWKVSYPVPLDNGGVELVAAFVRAPTRRTAGTAFVEAVNQIDGAIGDVWGENFTVELASQRGTQR